MSIGNKRRVLVVEDEWLIADQTVFMLEADDFVVVGPVPTVRMALALLEETCISCAVLDVNLNGEKSFPVAAEMLRRGKPFLFTTGYTSHDLPSELRDQLLLNKPLKESELRSALTKILS